HGAPVSEAAIAGMLALARGLPRAVRLQEQHQWLRFPAQLLNGKTVGIFGVGQIAEALAPKCKAFGMQVVGVTSAPRKIPGFDRMRGRGKLAKVVGDFAFLVALTPLPAARRNSIDAAIFAAMKPTSYLINLARGSVVIFKTDVRPIGVLFVGMRSPSSALRWPADRSDRLDVETQSV